MRMSELIYDNCFSCVMWSTKYRDESHRKIFYNNQNEEMRDILAVSSDGRHGSCRVFSFSIKNLFFNDYSFVSSQWPATYLLSLHHYHISLHNYRFHRVKLISMTAKKHFLTTFERFN